SDPTDRGDDGNGGIIRSPQRAIVLPDTSCESITSPSALILAHAPLPLGSLVLRFQASFGESLQVVTNPGCPRQLPDVSSENLFLDAGPHAPGVLRVLAPVSCTAPSAVRRRP